MDLRQLEAFAAVMSAGSVTAAGKMLGRSQPSVTRVIQELEQELGFALFERSGPKVTPTHKAFMMYGEVESALLGIRKFASARSISPRKRIIRSSWWRFRPWPPGCCPLHWHACRST